MEKITLQLLIFLSIMLIGCNKENAPDCIQSAGKPGSINYLPVEEVTEIILYDNIGINLTNSENDLPLYTVLGPTNLLNDISFELENGILSIRNENKCNWVRKYTTFLVEVKSNSLTKIYNYGSVGLEMPEYNAAAFTLEQESSLADNRLNFIGTDLTVNLHTGAGTAELSGSADNLYVYINGVTTIDASSFESPSIFANNSGRNNLITAPLDFMFAFIGGSGSILHNNLSANIDTEIAGTGSVEYSNY